MSVRSFDTVTVGEQLPERTLTVDRAGLVQYAGASLDRNPIHWDESFATGVGLPTVIAHGMWTMGAAVNLVADWAGDAGRIVEYGVRFSGMVLVPHGEQSEVAVSGVVKKLDAEARRATVELTVTFQGAKVLTRALATVDLA